MRLFIPQLVKNTSSPIYIDPLVVPPSATGAGTWAIAVNTSALHNGVYGNASTHADADNISYTVWIPYGTYSFYINMVKDTDSGKVDISLDGTKIISASDTYASSANYTTIQSTTSVAVSNAGLHTVKLALNGKNDSSSNHICRFTGFAFVRTA